jgi:hypothetical protein
MRRLTPVVACTLAVAALACDQSRHVTIPQGTTLAISLESTLASDVSRSGDSVRGTLVAPVMVDGVEVLPRGAVVTGLVSTAKPSGDVKGLADLGVRFTNVEAGATSVAIAASHEVEARPTKREDAEKIGVGAGTGAVIGAIVGGKKGAAIGGAVGGGVGTGVVLSTSGDEVRWPAGTILKVTLEGPVDVKVPARRDD